MSGFTAVLVRTQTTHLYVGSPGREAYLKIDTENEDLARELATTYLELHSLNAWTPTHTGHVLDGSQIPGDNYRPGDLMSGDRIQSVSIVAAEEGWAQVTPELGDVLTEREESLMRRINRLAQGVRAEWASPDIQKQEKGSGHDTDPPPFSLGQELYPSASPAWYATRPWWCAHFECSVETAGETATHVALKLGGGTIKTCVLEAGVKHRIIRVQHGWERGDVMTCEITVAGRKAANLTATPRGTMV